METFYDCLFVYTKIPLKNFQFNLNYNNLYNKKVCNNQ